MVNKKVHKAVGKGMHVMHKGGEDVFAFVDKGGDIVLDIASFPYETVAQAKKHKEIRGRMR